MWCFKCANEIKLTGIPGRLDECPQCRAELHCCLNCRFFEPPKPNNCMEPEAEYVTDKDRANFCELFQPNTKVVTPKRGTLTGEEARKMFNKLFGE